MAAEQLKKPTPPAPEQQQTEAARPPAINPAEDLDYQVETTAQAGPNLGMVEYTVGGVCGEDEDSPPGR